MRELSLGYRADIDLAPGTTPEGQSDWVRALQDYLNWDEALLSRAD